MGWGKDKRDDSDPRLLLKSVYAHEPAPRPRKTYNDDSNSRAQCIAKQLHRKGITAQSRSDSKVWQQKRCPCSRPGTGMSRPRDEDARRRSRIMRSKRSQHVCTYTTYTKVVAHGKSQHNTKSEIDRDLPKTSGNRGETSHDRNSGILGRLKYVLLQRHHRDVDRGGSEHPCCG